MNDNPQIISSKENPEEIIKLAKLSINYHFNKVKECIENDVWISAMAHLKILHQLAFHIDMIQQRHRLGIYDKLPLIFKDDEV